MAVTKSKLKDARHVGGEFEATYNLALDNSFDATGESVDVTGEFQTVRAAWIGGVDTLADGAYLYQTLVPSDDSAALTADSVKVLAFQVPSLDGNAASAQPLAHCDTVDLSAVGTLRLIVRGTQKI
jgi:hypothetical protein